MDMGAHTMTKQELLENMDESIRTEETASAIYLEHLKAIAARSGRNQDDVDRMRKLIEFLITENKGHKKILMELKERVSKEASDVY